MPQTEELDLSFQPSRTDDLKALTPNQVEHFNERGYVKPFDVFSSAEIRANREYFDGLLDELKRLGDGRDTYAINGYQTQCRGIYDIATDPRILDHVQDITGPDIVCWGTHFFCKTPHDPKSVPWHQDAGYWPLSPARTVTVWLAIDDADVENSCMHVIPGTHKMGRLKIRKADGAASLDQEIVGIDALGPQVPFELKAGQFSIHADMLAHGSYPNRSDRRRCGLTIRYCPPSVRVVGVSRWASQSIICRGRDTSGQWSDLPRPPGEDLDPNHRPISIGGN